MAGIMSDPSVTSSPTTATESGLGSAVMLEEPPQPTLSGRKRRASFIALRLPNNWVLPLVVVVCMVLGAWWVVRRADLVEREVARSLQGAQRNLTETSQQLRQASDSLRDSQSRLAALESKLSDSVAQQAQLERLYQELAQSRNDAVLAEVESTLVLAAQQLHLGGNVQAALLALQEADARLDRIRLPASSPLRRALTADILLLRQSESVDVASLAVQLDAIADGVDSLPLVADPQAPEKPARTKPTVSSSGTSETSAETVRWPWGISLPSWVPPVSNWGYVFDELQRWVRIRRVDRPDALLLAPEQSWFVRENLKLRIAQARWALLTRNDVALRADLGRAVSILERWFDRDQRSVAQSVEALGRVRTATAAIVIPSMQQSLSAIRLARAARERG